MQLLARFKLALIAGALCTSGTGPALAQTDAGFPDPAGDSDVIVAGANELGR